MSDHSAAPMIRLENVSKVFDAGRSDVHALNSVSLDILPGSIQGIIGFSGAGKSTLVRCIDLSGEAHFGPSVRRGTRADRHGGKGAARRAGATIGMIFQQLQPAHAAHRPVLSNRPLPARRAAGVPKAQKLEEPSGSCWSWWASGDQGRAPTPRSSPAARSSAWPSPGRWPANPKVLLCDEATSALDPHDHAGASCELLQRPEPAAWASPSSSSRTRWPWSRRSAPTWP